MLAWEKDDGTDIRSFAEAMEIADRSFAELQPYQRDRRGDFYVSSFNHPILKDRERTIDMTPAEYSNLLSTIDFDELFIDSVTREYFAPLLEKLRKNKNV
jgi:hypothetical protein